MVVVVSSLHSDVLFDCNCDYGDDEIEETGTIKVI